jgi:pimeloyl-ACP methyl ester carboxylesterase
MSIASPVQHNAIAGCYWQWRGYRVYFVRGGQGVGDRPPLLLVHGFGASTDHWRKNLIGLQERFEVWAIDLLGFGRSQKPDIVYSGDIWRDQLHDFIEQVIGRSTVVAGNSLGGYACLALAATYPDAVKGVILLNSAGPFEESPTVSKPINPLQNIVRSLLLTPWASFILFQFSRRRQTIRKTLKKVYLNSDAVSDRLVEEIYRPSCDRGAVKVFASVFKAPKGEPVNVLLGNCCCPLLLLWGEGDPWMNTQERGRKFRQYYNDLTEYYLQAGHCPHDEIPEEVNELISNWIIHQFAC